MKNIIRTVYSIAAGALLFAAPANAVSSETFENFAQGSKKALGYALFFGGCTAAGIAAKWLYDTYIRAPQNHEYYDAMNAHVDRATKIRVAAQHDAQRMQPALAKQEEALAAMHNNLVRAGNQAKTLPQAVHNTDLKQAHEAARIVVQEQRKAQTNLKNLIEAQKANQGRLGSAVGLLPILQVQLMNQHTRELGHLHNAGQSLNQAGKSLDATHKDLAQSEHNIRDAEENVRQGFQNIHRLFDQPNSRESAHRGRMFIGQRPMINQRPVLAIK